MPPGSLHLDWAYLPRPRRHPDAVAKSNPPLPRGGTDSDTSSEDDDDGEAATLIIDSRHIARRDPGAGPASPGRNVDRSPVERWRGSPSIEELL